MWNNRMTIREATEEWVREMNAIPQGMIEKLMNIGNDDIYEVTEPVVGDRVYCYQPLSEHCGVIEDIYEDGQYHIQLDNDSWTDAERDDFEVERDGGLPMWGTMWTFGDSSDDWWLEEGDGIKLMSECGFRVYESEDFGFIFGIDGAGYDFYESHWIPLYKARGLRWHDPAAEAAEFMVNEGRKQTTSGNYHFEFDEIEDMVGAVVDEKFKKRVYEYVFGTAGYCVAELDMSEDFDFVFYTAYCPNAEEE